MSMFGHQIDSVSRRPRRSAGQSLAARLTQLADLRSRIGFSEALAIGLGLLLTTCGSLWAVQEGAATPIVWMAAYCMLAATAALAIALRVLRNAGATVEAAKPASVGPNVSAWKLLSSYNVSNASRLWCDVEPGHPYTQESAAWAAAMLDAIKTGVLPILPRPGASEEAVLRERSHPTWHTTIARDALKSWAMQHGRCPAFLQN
jgi:hypothetical protein